MREAVRPYRSRARLNGACGLLAAVALLAAACERPPDPYTRTLYTFGTLASIRLDGASRQAAEAAADALEHRLALRNRDWYAWGDGELGSVNRTLAAANEATLSAGLAGLIERALALRTLTGGRFDPTVGSAVALWGLHSGDAAPQVPDAAALRQAQAGAAAALIADADGTRLRAAAPGLVIDLGGIAKGAALEEALALLAAHRIPRGIVDLGGDLIVRDDSGRRPARVGIRDPRGDGVIGIIAATDGEAVVTSGDYERYFERDGRRFHHIIDPATGEPAAARAVAATVIGYDPVVADALATALVVAGPGELDALCEAAGVAAALVVDTDGELHLTAAMRERLDYQ